MSRQIAAPSPDDGIVKIDGEYIFRTLARNITRLEAGDVTPAAANAVVNSTAGILRYVKLQMDYAKMTGQTPHIPLLLGEPPQG